MRSLCPTSVPLTNKEKGRQFGGVPTQVRWMMTGPHRGALPGLRTLTQTTPRVHPLPLGMFLALRAMLAPLASLPRCRGAAWVLRVCRVSLP